MSCQLASALRALTLCYVLALCCLACSSTTETTQADTGLEGRIICIDAGHGGTAATDSYRVGPSGEREEWINLRVALLLQEMLEAAGAEVIMTRTEDVAVGLEERGRMAIENNADVFVSIHHNATADSSVNFPILYYHANASENPGSVSLARQIGKYLLAAMYEGDTLISIVSDHTIFPEAGTSVLRHSYGIPGIIGEASFFTHPAEEQRLRQENYNRQEARAYLQALQAFFSMEPPPVKEKYSVVEVPPFAVLQEADRMRPEARLWLQDYRRGKALYAEGQLDTAYQLLTRSARNFPDSYVAGDAHRLRSQILEQQDSTQAALSALLRVTEFYVDFADTLLNRPLE